MSKLRLDGAADASVDGAPSAAIRDAHPPMEAAIRGARPPIDAIAMDVVRARAEQALFGVTAPTRLGRYTIVDRVAGGGMGVVYRADDPELHRQVALKILHPRQHGDDRARRRMLAEARALAKLDHPNVLEIYDVLTVDGQIVLVMPLVEGGTLATWERGQSRPWRAIVDAYAQAADGLAAAHAVGVVHRDFKPANAVIHPDGRVRVIDFGLARTLEGDAPIDVAFGSPDEPPRAGQDLTSTGEIVGTLGYTSPEQLAGGAATPASDQFSFCVALHRALEGVPPFDGKDLASLAASIRGGAVSQASDGRRIPGWLRALVRRGLANDPAARFPSMAELVASLRRARGWRRRWPLAVGAALTVGIAGLTLAFVRSPAAAEAATCSDGTAEMAGVWDDWRRARLEGTLAAIDHPLTASVLPRVLGKLDAYRAGWMEFSSGSCEAHRANTLSDITFERQMRCLERDRKAFRGAVDVLARSDHDTIANAIDVAVGLPPLAACEDLDRSQATTAVLPGFVSHGIEAVRDDLARAKSLARAGRASESRELAAESVRKADALGFPPLIAEASLRYGTVLLEQEAYAEAVAPLKLARETALKLGMDVLAVEAGARQIFVEKSLEDNNVDILRDESFLVPISERLVDDHFVRPLLLNNIGSVHLGKGDTAKAYQYFRDAKLALSGVQDPDIELSSIDQNLGLLTPDDDARKALMRSVWERRKEVLGPDHLQTLQALGSYARAETDPARALELISQQCRTYKVDYEDMSSERARCESYQAFLTEALDRRAQARALYEAIAELQAVDDDPDDTSFFQLAVGHARRLAGDWEGAIAALAPVVAKYGSSLEWWKRSRSAGAVFGIGLAELALDRRRQGEQHLRAAADAYDALYRHTFSLEYRLHAERARSALPKASDPSNP